MNTIKDPPQHHCTNRKSYISVTYFLSGNHLTEIENAMVEGNPQGGGGGHQLITSIKICQWQV